MDSIRAVPSTNPLSLMPFRVFAPLAEASPPSLFHKGGYLNRFAAKQAAGLTVDMASYDASLRRAQGSMCAEQDVSETELAMRAVWPGGPPKCATVCISETNRLVLLDAGRVGRTRGASTLARRRQPCPSGHGHRAS